MTDVRWTIFEISKYDLWDSQRHGESLKDAAERIITDAHPCEVRDSVETEEGIRLTCWCRCPVVDCPFHNTG